MPGTPALSNDTWSVWLTDRGPIVVTPRSCSGAIHASKIGRAAMLLCSQMPRTLPVPLSELKYAASFACSGFSVIVSTSAEVIADVGARAEQSLLLAAP